MIERDNEWALVIASLFVVGLFLAQLRNPPLWQRWIDDYRFRAFGHRGRLSLWALFLRGTRAALRDMTGRAERITSNITSPRPACRWCERD